MAASGEEARKQFYFTVLKHAAEIKVNWKGVAAEVGIKYTGNASTKFQAYLKQDGLKFCGGSIIPLNQGLPASNALVVPKKRKKEAAAQPNEQNDCPTKKIKQSDQESEEAEDHGVFS